MIEFKADCGHTVRAKDEDAGKVVRCAYCGREAQVPQEDQDELDFLFGEISSESSAAAPSPKTARRARKTDRAGMPFGPSRTTVDPFAVVKKMAYVAAVLICVIFVGKKYAWPMFSQAFLDGGKPTSAISPPAVTKRPSRNTGDAGKPTASSRTSGFLPKDLAALGPGQGVYVDAIPERVTVYYREEDASTKKLDWLLSPDVTRLETPGLAELDPGTYVFVAALPINDKQLMRKYGKGYGYKETRGDAEDEKDQRDKDKIIDGYFRPDGATDVGVFQVRERPHIVRQYEVTVYSGEWSLLTPQFLPFRCTLAETMALVPDRKAYGFEEADVELELDYHSVKQRDRVNILSILRRIGTISYDPAEGRGGFRLFKIDPLSGELIAVQLPKGVHDGQSAPGES